MDVNIPDSSQRNIVLVKHGPKIGRLILLTVLIVFLMGGAGAGAYYYRDLKAKDADKKASAQIKALQDKVSSLEKQLASQSSSNGSSNSNSSSGNGQGQTNTLCSPVQPSAATIDNIKASITSGNTAALEGYMASSVNVVFAASDGLGPRTAVQAVGDITSFIDDITQMTWSFDVPASVLSSYGQSSYKQYFPGTALVGKSSTNRVISFNFDCSGKISAVLMAMNESELQ